MSKKTLSLDLRERVVAAVAGGVSRRQAAERFGASAASAIRWCSREKETIAAWAELCDPIFTDPRAGGRMN